MKPFIVALALAGMSTLVFAKLPPPSDEAKTKAAETAAKNAHNDKVGAYQLCLSMDKVAARYLADAAKAGKAVQPTPTPPCADPGAFVYVPPGAAPAVAAAPAAAAVTSPSLPGAVAPAAGPAPAKKP